MSMACNKYFITATDANGTINLIMSLPSHDIKAFLRYVHRNEWILNSRLCLPIIFHQVHLVFSFQSYIWLSTHENTIIPLSVSYPCPSHPKTLNVSSLITENVTWQPLHHAVSFTSFHTGLHFLWPRLDFVTQQNYTGANSGF